MKNPLFYAMVFVAGVFISSMSQVLLKKSAQTEYKSKLQEYLNPYVMTGYFFFFGATLLSVLAYRGIPLSMGPVLEASGYFFVTFFGVKIFHEKMSRKKVIGLILIICGIVVYSCVG